MSDPLELVLGRLQGVKRTGRAALAKCPAHEDRDPSLSVSVGREGQVLLNCHAGCSFDSIAGALGMQAREFFPTLNGTSRGTDQKREIACTYDYTDEDGGLLYQTVRYLPKDFRQRRPDGQGDWIWNLDGVRRVLFHLPQIQAGVSAGDPVHLVEGEKDVLALEQAGAVATCNPMGAGKWRAEYSESLRGADVVIIADRDTAGRDHAATVANALKGVARSCRIVEAATGKDAADHLAAGKTVAEFVPVEGLSSPDRPPLVRALRDILANPELLQPPPAVVPRFVYTGRVTLLVAREKDGKSTLAAAIAAHVSSGGPFLGYPVTRGPVLWVGLEEHIGDLARRFVAFGADPDHLHVVVSLPNWLEDLTEAVAQVQPVALIVDTLAALADGHIEDPYDSVAWTGIMRQVTGLARTHEVAILLVAHARKSDGKYRDSTAIGANVDQILEMEADKEDPTVRAFTPKGRWPIPPFRIRLEGSEYHLASGEISHETKVLFQIQAHPGCSKRAIREAVGGRAAETDASLDRLLRAEAIEDRGDGRKGAYWPKRVSEPCPNRVPRDGTRSTPDTLHSLCPSELVAGQSADTLPDTAAERVPTLSVSQLQTRRVGDGHTITDTPERGDAWEAGGEAA